MKPLIVLVVVFLFGLIWTQVFDGIVGLPISGRIAMSVMLFFTAIGHFRYSKGMSLMIPAIIPLKRPLVYLTGLIEIVAGLGLILPFMWKGTAWFLIGFFILILPANIYAAIHHVDYEKGTYDGPGPSYLWFRVPLQIFFIAWVYYFAILLSPRM
jgi:uncharacterized membrane protein